MLLVLRVSKYKVATSWFRTLVGHHYLNRIYGFAIKLKFIKIKNNEVWLVDLPEPDEVQYRLQ